MDGVIHKWVISTSSKVWPYSSETGKYVLHYAIIQNLGKTMRNFRILCI